MTNDTKTQDWSYIASLQKYADGLVAKAKNDSERVRAEELAAAVEMVDLLVQTYETGDKELVRVGLNTVLSDKDVTQVVLMVLLGLVHKSEKGRAKAAGVLDVLTPELRDQLQDVVLAKSQDAPK